jgi:hypothetical protein
MPAARRLRAQWWFSSCWRGAWRPFAGQPRLHCAACGVREGNEQSRHPRAPLRLRAASQPQAKSPVLHASAAGLSHPLSRAAAATRNPVHGPTSRHRSSVIVLAALSAAWFRAHTRDIERQQGGSLGRMVGAAPARPARAYWAAGLHARALRVSTVRASGGCHTLPSLHAKPCPTPCAP